MKKRSRIALALVVLAILAGLAWMLLRPHEPVYEGKRLSVWMEDLDFSKAGTPEYTKAHEVIGKIGTNALPTLLRMIRMKDESPSVLKLIDLARAQDFIKIRYTPAANRRSQAAAALSELGPLAADAVPVLLEIYEQNLSPQSQTMCTDVMTWIGPGAKAAIPALIRGMTNQDEDVRCSLLLTLARIHEEPALVVPEIISALHDTNSVIRMQAASALEDYAAHARSAVPVLLELVQDENPHVRCNAVFALDKIHPEPDRLVPVLIKLLQDPDAHVRGNALAALQQYGAEAKPAVPALLPLLNNSDLHTRMAATNTLKAIDLEAAIRAGITN